MTITHLCIVHLTDIISSTIHSKHMYYIRINGILLIRHHHRPLLHQIPNLLPLRRQ